MKFFLMGIFMLGVLSAQAGKYYEFVLYREAGRDYSNDVRPEDVTVMTNYRFNDPPILSFHVPALKNRDAVIFKAGARVNYSLSDFQTGISPLSW